MTREEFDSKSFDELIEILNDNYDDIHDYENMKEFAKYQIDNNNIYFARHILDAIDDNYNSEWFKYDFSMGTLEEPVALSFKDDLVFMIDD